MVRFIRKNKTLSKDCMLAYGLLRRKRLAMTSEVVELLAMTNKVTRFFAMAEGALVIARKNQPAMQTGDAATWKG